VLFVALVIIYLNSFFVSVALSRQYRSNIRLTQQLALLEETLMGDGAAAGDHGRLTLGATALGGGSAAGPAPSPPRRCAEPYSRP
jgi:hypothetical protein